ncbi:MAG TPA: ATP-dependent Clp protease ATP-binding subunit [Clostridiales bacterium]|nr:ATP-dependent Clp protease ATP-binding subunit [Clostridiales bacterium]HCS10412.1 ATP-dependent Clp protease ATP-binding subunit [Clostridiales bacterium]
MNRLEDLMPKWQKELSSFKGIKCTFIVEGNINDVYPSFSIKDTGEYEKIDFCTLNRAIVNIFESSETKGYYDFLFCNPLFGFVDPLNFNYTPAIVSRYERIAEDNEKQVIAMNGSEKREAHSDTKMINISEIIRAAITQAVDNIEEDTRRSIAVVINYASHFVTSPENLSIDETTFFLNLLHASNNAIRGNKFTNTIILIVDKFNDIPPWFYLNNPNIRTISIPNPDRSIRNIYVDKYFTAFNEDLTPETQKIKKKFVDLTDGMKTCQLSELRRLYNKREMHISEILDIVSIYKYGFKDNQWERIIDKISDIKERIEERVMGQEQAVEKIVRVIKRAVSGLSGMQHSSESSKPRGILFLAGPTGTGKTEIVKAIAEALFEDEKTLIRFDMSEYTAEHSDQKLFGAPPGYVGYDNGGQLTNAVKNNPFSILLFDEIEKAHPNIMDKFLQILEDGRMTDGQGNTVYFSETLIFFTSNVGISRETIDPITSRVVGRTNIVKPGEPYDVIQSKVEEAVKTYFKPEVINRIGENIVVFNYIEESASKAIAKSKIDKINININKQKKICITLTDNALEKFYSLCREDKPRANGGRGIGNVIEERYLNPLAEFLFDNKCKEGDSIKVYAESEEIIFKKE